MTIDISIKKEKVTPINLGFPAHNEDFLKVSASGVVIDEQTSLTVFVNRKVYEAIKKHARLDQRNEVGGALVGFYCRDTDLAVDFLVITDVLNFMPPDSIKSASHLTFTNKFLEQLDGYMEQLNNEDTELRRLGFFHTHPGYGVFLSSTDIRTFKGIFKDDWQIAMVVDPVNNKEGVFSWLDGRIWPSNHRSNGIYIFDSDTHMFNIHKATTSDSDLYRYNRHTLIPCSKEDEPTGNVDEKNPIEQVKADEKVTDIQKDPKNDEDTNETRNLLKSTKEGIGIPKSTSASDTTYKGRNGEYAPRQEDDGNGNDPPEADSTKKNMLVEEGNVFENDNDTGKETVQEASQNVLLDLPQKNTPASTALPVKQVGESIIMDQARHKKQKVANGASLAIPRF